MKGRSRCETATVQGIDPTFAQCTPSSPSAVDQALGDRTEKDKRGEMWVEPADSIWVKALLKSNNMWGEMITIVILKAKFNTGKYRQCFSPCAWRRHDSVHPTYPLEEAPRVFGAGDVKVRKCPAFCSL